MSDAHLSRLGRWIASLRYEGIPASALRAARYQLVDMVAALHAAGQSREILPILRGVRGFASAQGGRATALATGERLGPCEAAMTNAAYSMAQDFDDIIWMGHTCHSAIFAPLAVAEHEAASARELLTAIVVANEIGGRLGASSFLGPLNGQMWTFVHLVGAAAATAKLLGLDAGTTTHAIAIALAQPNFALQPGFMAPSSKLLAASTPTATGIQAAYFARAGMTGHASILEDRRGFWRRFAFLPLPMMLEGLGDFWAIETLTIKTFPGCHYFQTTLSAIERLRARGLDLREGSIERVHIEATKLACEVTRFAADYASDSGALTPVGVNFDLAQSAAILLSAGRLTVAELESSYLAEHEAEIRAMRNRIDVRHDPELSAEVLASAKGIAAGRQALREIRMRDLAMLARRYADEYGSRLFSFDDAMSLLRRAPRAFGFPRAAAREAHESTSETDGSAVALRFPSRVTVELRDGRRETERVDLPVGAFCAPGVESELEIKLLAAATPALGDARARIAFDAAMNLDTMPLSELVALISAGPLPGGDAREVERDRAKDH